ncbi:MAG TPA: DUF4145 domain-containing protein [Nitratidesulfovibrio sp.]|nr:DUF4145 domain-containing protein [Nitratidesulfovibrio sp.]
MSKFEIGSQKKATCPHCSKRENDKRMCTIKGTNVTTLNEEHDGEVYEMHIDGLFSCNGCGYPFFKRIHLFSEYDEPIGIYTFPETSGYGVRDEIDITQDLEECDDIIRIYKEIRSAINNQLFTLAAMGTRTLLDRSIVKITNEDAGTFKGNIDKAVSKNLISKVDQELLMPILDVGGRAAHMCYTPSEEDVKLWFGIVTTIIKYHIITPKRAEAAKSTIPPRK